MSDQPNEQQNNFGGEYRKNYSNRRGAFSKRPFRSDKTSNHLNGENVVDNSCSSLAVSSANSSKHFNYNSNSGFKDVRKQADSVKNETGKTVVHSNLNPNAPSFTSGYAGVNNDESSAPQRGKIVGGRYVRKHTSQGSRSNQNAANNEPVECDKNSNPQNYKSKQAFSQRSQKKDYTDSKRFGRNVEKEYSDNNYSTHNLEKNNELTAQSEHTRGHYNYKHDYSLKSHKSSTNYNSNKYSNSKNLSFRNNSSHTHGSNSKKFENADSAINRNETSYGASHRQYQKSSQNEHRRMNNEYASSDVYHFSSKCTIDKKSVKPAREPRTASVSIASTLLENEATQRELLIQRLSKGECECLVCCEQIRIKDSTWHCLSCYHVFHLRCIRKWARSPAASVEDGSWRCPACQSLTSKVPYDYVCFCSKQVNPEVNYHFTPHSCGEVCNRKRPECDHLCTELCHPGPCPQCSVFVQKYCPCGKTFKTTTCKLSGEETCNSTCDKPLNCGIHKCKRNCHHGECLPCEVSVMQECFCKKAKRSVTCTSSTATVSEFPCGDVCSKSLDCGNHICDNVCHPGPCSLCSLSVSVVKSCNCGKSSVQELISSGRASVRKSCTDPIPVCGEKCEKDLPCGPKNNPHTCQSLCHVGDCPKCPLSTSLKCRCGAVTKQFNCSDISASFIFLCEKRCNRRKNCGRHKCLNNCCVNTEHRCELICNKKLSCGKHQCQETCHAGNCPTCWNVSFDELRCHCGETVLYPPIHCGTRPPECSQPCVRRHSCDHEVKHTCHSDDSCPPCTFLTTKWCYGRHKQCGTVMCFMEGVSCGMLCQKELPCGKHKCNLTCHDGPCLKENARCPQRCPEPRLYCGHPCGSPCHTDECPETPCKTQVTLNCPCGHRSETSTCHESTRSTRLTSVSVLASKMQDVKDGQSVNLNEVIGRKSKKLQCNEECAVIERNKRLAVALQIQNPDLSPSPGPPNYSEFLKAEAKKSPSFVFDVYDKIAELVQLAKESKQKCRSHSFPPMKRDHRRVVHELAEFFGCETQSYDEEPKKSVVVTAYKSKCWFPFASIMTVVQRDMGFRKGPAPMIAKNPPSTVTSSAAPLSTVQKKKIDYFDYKE